MVLLSCLRRFALLTSAACTLLLAAPALQAQQDKWTVPTADELALTSIPEIPNAPALYLYREQTTEDALHMYSYYSRIKILTEGGKEQANVELPFILGEGGFTLDSIAGRTIHPDGTVIPFTGKPYDKLVVKDGGHKLMTKVFTLPSVEVGSILEYRYKLRFDDMYFMAPDWEVQTDLFTRKAHFMWLPTTRELMFEDGPIGSVAWTPILPPGAHVIQTARPGGNNGIKIDLEVANVKPIEREQFMPPPDSLSYRVMFYYARYGNEQEYWKNAGKTWSKQQDRFIGPGSGVKAVVARTIAPGDSDELKLKKLYDLVETYDNTRFSREHTAREEKAAGFKETVNNTDDVLARKRGTDDQLTELFIAMARAAGFKAYAMGVADRSKRIFIPAYLSTRQMDDVIAIVVVGGKEHVYDPGQRYCTYGHISWKHSMTSGLRQTDGEVKLSTTPGEPPKTAHVTRVADLTLDERGEATGTVKVTEEGDSALYWRQEALRSDDVEMNTELKASLEELLPGGMEVRVTNVDNLSNPDKPLTISYEIKGGVGAPTGKRLLIPASLFEVNSKPTFPSATREQAIFMNNASYVQDAVRYKYPPTLAIESVPEPETGALKQDAAYDIKSKQSPGSVTLFRNVMLATYLFGVGDYPQVRGYYQKLETKDKDTLVLVRATSTVPAATASISASKP